MVRVRARARFRGCGLGPGLGLEGLGFGVLRGHLRQEDEARHLPRTLAAHTPACSAPVAHAHRVSVAVIGPSQPLAAPRALSALTPPSQDGPGALRTHPLVLDEDPAAARGIGWGLVGWGGVCGVPEDCAWCVRCMHVCMCIMCIMLACAWWGEGCAWYVCGMCGMCGMCVCVCVACARHGWVTQCVAIRGVSKASKCGEGASTEAGTYAWRGGARRVP